MRDTYQRLARRIPANLPGPVVVLGLAETAVALAQGVHDAWLQASGRDDVLFLHTTRYRLNAPLALSFEEEHSHASQHLVHAPAEAADAALFAAARTLILVDDEASTGTTFVNLARAFSGGAVEQVVCVTITDWSPDFRERMPVPTTVVSLLEGSYRFTPVVNAAPVEMPRATGNNESKAALLPRNRGRRGLRGPLGWEGALPAVRPGTRVLVLGTGEFTYLPFRVAERLEAAGADVWCQATTRSPVLVGNDIASAVTFPDNYDDGIPNFLYNFVREDYDLVLLCHETPQALLPRATIEALGATPLEL